MNPNADQINRLVSDYNKIIQNFLQPIERILKDWIDDESVCKLESYYNQAINSTLELLTYKKRRDQSITQANVAKYRS